MTQRPLSRYAHELHEILASGALAGRGSVQMNDGLVVEIETMTRLVLADFERLTKVTRISTFTSDDERQVYDDLRRLHHLATELPARNANNDALG